MELPDGKGYLGYAVYGAAPSPHRIPIVYHTGTPGCRLNSRTMHAWGQSQGITFIALERPGYGISTWHKSSILEHTQNAIYLVEEHLGYRKYDVYGVSGGGPYALAHAYCAGRSAVRGTAIMCGATPPDAPRLGQSFARWWWEMMITFHPPLNRPEAVRICRNMKLRREKNPTQEEKLKYLVEDESYKQGVDGYLYDYSYFNQNWGFRLEDIDANPIIMYYGEHDTDTPVSGAHYIKKRIKAARLKVFEGADHHGVQDNVWDLLRELRKLA
ncbi:Alpha/Beta hydrolase protein [Massariosphaeria phaeospora]|uniref:Alpha/Beta hydrolase protein n=1 Tax=Massariosphaeria phaeospora TaxID=100035 RepID=A0A7C8M8Y8_9PLEO|nr:Alpha/Beta hydrolase protein [Massariosphaeria phaeospora]